MMLDLNLSITSKFLEILLVVFVKMFKIIVLSCATKVYIESLYNIYSPILFLAQNSSLWIIAFCKLLCVHLNISEFGCLLFSVQIRNAQQ